MRAVKFNQNLIFPVIYDSGLLLKNKNGNGYLFYKDNSVKILTDNELEGEEIHYPETQDEILTLKNVIEFIYNRLLISQKNVEENLLLNALKEIIFVMDRINEELLYFKLRDKYKDK